jgi:hypothetical protein
VDKFKPVTHREVAPALDGEPRHCGSNWCNAWSAGLQLAIEVGSSDACDGADASALPARHLQLSNL